MFKRKTHTCTFRAHDGGVRSKEHFKDRSDMVPGVHDPLHQRLREVGPSFPVVEIFF